MPDRFAEAFRPDQSEKDRAVAIARRILAGHYLSLVPGEYETLARQYLRELHLPVAA